MSYHHRFHSTSSWIIPVSPFPIKSYMHSHHHGLTKFYHASYCCCVKPNKQAEREWAGVQTVNRRNSSSPTPAHCSVRWGVLYACGAALGQDLEAPLLITRLPAFGEPSTRSTPRRRSPGPSRTRSRTRMPRHPHLQCKRITAGCIQLGGGSASASNAHRVSLGVGFR